MNGSTASVSDDRTSVPGGARRELVVSVNWIGDAIMAMPALQLYRQRHPQIEITILARGVVADVWKLHAAPHRVISYSHRPSLFDPLFTTLREEAFDCAWVWPNSFRSAWMAFRSGIPRRIGATGGLRLPLLTDVRRTSPHPDRKHQAWECMYLMLPEAVPEVLPAPELRIPDALRQDAITRHEAWTTPVIGMIPGAARGPSKRWPVAHFISLAKRFASDGYQLALFGGPDDQDVCREIADAVGARAMNYAGRTSIADWAVLLAQCDLVVANDSGGMHLAAALRRPLIALYGMTDPERTGPLGGTAVIMQNSSHRSRAIARDSIEAQKSLASIHPEAVYESAQMLLKKPA